MDSVFLLPLVLLLGSAPHFPEEAGLLLPCALLFLLEKLCVWCCWGFAAGLLDVLCCAGSGPLAGALFLKLDEDDDDEGRTLFEDCWLNPVAYENNSVIWGYKFAASWTAILCLTLRTTVTSARIPEEDASHRACNLCVFSRVQKGTPGLTHKGCVLQHVSLGALSDITVVLGMRQSI